MNINIDAAVSAFFAQFSCYVCLAKQHLENFTAYNTITRRYVNWNIPVGTVPDFLDSYWELVRQGDRRVVVQEMLRASNGIVFDFDLYANNSQQISAADIEDLVMMIYDQIQEVSATASTWLWFGIKDPRIKDTVYKKSFRVHVISPQANVYERDFIIKGIKALPAFVEWCRRHDPQTPAGTPLPNVADCLDTQAHRNPAGLFYSSKPPAAPAYEILPPHNFYKLYNISQNGRRTNVQTYDLSQMAAYNIAKELSLSQPGTLIAKCNIVMNAGLDIKNSLPAIQNNIQSVVSADAECAEIWRLLELLPESAYENYDTWFRVIGCIKSAGEKHKMLAIEWSRRSKKFDAFKFEQLWLSMRPYTNGYLMLRKILRDNTSATLYAQYEHETTQNHVMSEISGVLGNRGELTDMVVANIMRLCHRSRFVSDGDSYWYSFIEPSTIGENDRTRHYKWAKSRRNDVFRMLVATTLGNILPSIIQKLEYQENEKTKQGKASDVKGIKAIRTNLNRAYNRYQSAPGIAGVAELARALFTNQMFIKELDLVKNAIGVCGGVLLLGVTAGADGIAMPNPQLLNMVHDLPITKSAAAEYIPYTAELAQSAKFRMVLQFFMDFFPHNEYDAFYWMMHVIGQSVSGEIKTPMLINCIGSGRNGKTALTEYVSAVLGIKQYADILPMSVFTGRVTDAQKSNPAIMALKGLRWGTVTESRRGDILADDQLKTMVGGGGLMSARGHHQEQQSFEPSATMVSTSNYKLRVNSNDHGTWRRLRYLEMKNRMVSNPDESKPNDRYGDRRWTDEYRRDQDLINIAFTIFVEFYYSIKLNYKYALDKIPCITVENETVKYQNDCDTVARFIDRRIVKTGNQGDVLTLIEISREYKNYCMEQSSKTTLDLVDAQNIISSSSLANDFDKSSDSCTLVGYVIGNSATSAPPREPINHLAGNEYVHRYVPLRYNQRELGEYYSNFNAVMSVEQFDI